MDETLPLLLVIHPTAIDPPTIMPRIAMGVMASFSDWRGWDVGQHMVQCRELHSDIDEGEERGDILNTHTHTHTHSGLAKI